MQVNIGLILLVNRELTKSLESFPCTPPLGVASSTQ